MVALAPPSRAPPRRIRRAHLLLAADASPDAVAKECADLLGDTKSVVALTVDLADPSAVMAMVAQAEKAFGRIDLLVNNAAVRINRKFGDFTLAEFLDQAVAVNLRAPFLASQAVLPAMRRQGGGRIVHVASQLGSVAYQTRTAYGMSKAALIHLHQVDGARARTREHPGQRGLARADRHPADPRSPARRSG